MSKFLYFILFCTVGFGVGYAQKIGFRCESQIGVNGIDLLTGNVALKQGNTIVYCNKAELNRNSNTFVAYGNVHVVQNGTTDIYSELLNWDGNTEMGRFSDNVRLVDDGKTLFTPNLDFNSQTNSGYFYNGGKVVDKDATLTSKSGNYYPSEKFYIFRDKVVVTGTDYVLYSDTLRYYTQTSKAQVFGPTHIYGKDSAYCYTENGWYDTQTELGQFNKNSFFRNNQQKMWGDTLVYERKNGIARGFNNVVLWDSIQNIFVKGNRMVYYKNPEHAIVTNKAQFIQADKKDTMYLHADTLYTEYDSSGVYRIVKAYKRARIFRNDLQAKSDSIVYSMKDSVIHLYKLPIVWSEGNQVTADKIEVYTQNKRPYKMEMINSSFISSKEDEIRFNQIKGKNMTGYFKDNHLYLIIVNSNGETLYFAKDKEKLIGMNKAEGSKIKIYIKKNKPEKILFFSKPIAVLHPIEKLKPEDIVLKDFKWFEHIRPKDKNDIFEWRE